MLMLLLYIAGAYVCFIAGAVWQRARQNTKVGTPSASHNNAMPSCQGCGLEHQSKINATCSVCARTHHDYWHERQ